MDNTYARHFDILIVTGPTASGKTSLAAAMANILEGEVVSADSRQVYRNMDIGTGKDYSDYVVGGTRIPCHLIDICDPGYKYNVFEYQRDFLKVFNDLRSREKFPVVCGGSGMYIDCIVSGYKMHEVPPDNTLRATLEKKSLKELTGILVTLKDLHNTTDVDTKKRAIRAIEIELNSRKEIQQPDFPEIRPLVIGLMHERSKRRELITRRLKMRLAGGMIEEVKALLEKGIAPDDLIYYGLEYKYITLYLTHSLSYNEMFSQLETAIHQFAKRQMTWFRGMERRGIKINWIDGDLPMDKKIDLVMNLLYL